MLKLFFFFFFFYNLFDTDINCLIWGGVLFASAIRLEILSLFTFTHNLFDDVCEVRVWIYSDFKCLLAWIFIFYFFRRHD